MADPADLAPEENTEDQYRLNRDLVPSVRLAIATSDPFVQRQGKPVAEEE